VRLILHRRQLDVGKVLGDTFRIYREHAAVLIGAAFWVLGIGAVGVELLYRVSLLLFPLIWAVQVLTTTFYAGMVVELVRDVQRRWGEGSIRGLVGAVAPVARPLIGAGIFAGSPSASGSFSGSFRD
jgi:hypothetical protein